MVGSRGKVQRTSTPDLLKSCKLNFFFFFFGLIKMKCHDNELPNKIFFVLNHDSEVVTSWKELVKPPICPEAAEDTARRCVSVCQCKLMMKPDNHLQP